MTQVISFHYTLTGRTGAVIDRSEGKEPLSFLEGNGGLIPELERQISQLAVGDRRRVELAAKDAYGVRQESLVIKVELSKLPNGSAKAGDKFRGGQEDHAPVFTVTSVEGNQAVLDGNHPLAGQDLVFDIEVTGKREATAEEMSHGHAHDGDGHRHH